MDLIKQIIGYLILAVLVFSPFFLIGAIYGREGLLVITGIILSLLSIIGLTILALYLIAGEE